MLKTTRVMIIILALASLLAMGGGLLPSLASEAYAATTPGLPGDGQQTITYVLQTGQVVIDTEGNDMNSYALQSGSGIFTGDPANFIGGTIFQQDTDFIIGENFFSPIFNGVHDLGLVGQTGLSKATLLNDLTLGGGLTGNPNFLFDLYVVVVAPGAANDGKRSVVYDPSTGSILIDSDGNNTNSYIFNSETGIFTGSAPNFIGGTIFQTDTDFIIAENFFSPTLSGVHDLGPVAPAGLSEALLRTDLFLEGGLSGNPNFEFDLIYLNTSNVHVWNTPAVSEVWGTAGNWLATGVPASDWIAIVENVQAYDQTAVVTANSTVDRITVSGQTNTMNLHVQNGVDLTATTSVVVDSLGVARVDGTLATTTFDVNSGGGVRAEVSTPSVNHISADEGVGIAAGASLTIDQGATPGAGAHLFHILQADADSAGGELVSGTFDTVSLPGDDGLARRYSVLYENRAADGVGAVDTVKVGLARPGDADFNSLVDALDLLAASPFFGTTTPANWRQGNWNDTGSSQGIVDAIDLLDASPFFSQTYGEGDLLLGGDDTTPGQNADGEPSICYDYTTGEVTIDTDGNTTNTYVLDSLSGIFTGLPPNFIGGTFFSTDNDFRIAENFHTNLNGVHNLGAVAQTGLSLGFLLNDLTLQGGSAGNPNFEFDLVVKNTPEPSTIVLIGLGLLGVVGAARRRRA